MKMSIRGEEMILVFAGNWDEYAEWVQETGWTASDVEYARLPIQVPIPIQVFEGKPNIDFIFFEVGTYGTNKAWQFMREQYGYAVEERNEYHGQMLALLKELHPDVPNKKYYMVRDSMYSIACRKMSQGSLYMRMFNLPTEIKRPSYYHDATVQMESIISKAGILLGHAGKCECGRLYYSLRLVANNVHSEDVETMLSQIATSMPFSLMQVCSVYSDVKDIVETERLCGLLTVIPNYGNTNHWLKKAYDNKPPKDFMIKYTGKWGPSILSRIIKWIGGRLNG
jgi:hypothetical protein